MQDDGILLINVDLLTLNQDSCSIIFLHFSHTSHQRHQRTLNAAAVPATVLRRFEDDLPSWKPHRRHRAIGCSSCSKHILIIFLLVLSYSYPCLIHAFKFSISPSFLLTPRCSVIFRHLSVQVGSTSWLSTCHHETRPCSWVRQASSCWRPALGRLLGLPRTAMLSIWSRQTSSWWHMIVIWWQRTLHTSAVYSWIPHKCIRPDYVILWLWRSGCLSLFWRVIILKLHLCKASESAGVLRGLAWKTSKEN